MVAVSTVPTEGTVQGNKNTEVSHPSEWSLNRDGFRLVVKQS